MPGQWRANLASQAPGPAVTDAPAMVRPAQLAPRDPAHPSFPFYKLCLVMEAIRDAQGHEKKREKLVKFFDLYRAKIGLDLYPVIRLMIPERDRERTVFQLKEGKLAKTYNAVLGIDSKTNSDAYRLENWKTPAVGNNGAPVDHVRTQGGTGDFPSVLYSILRVKSTGKDNYTIEQVNDKLDELAAVRGDQKAAARVIKDFERNLSPESQHWLSRIILKDVKLTLKEKSILDVYHPDAMRLFIVCSDLKRVCWTLWDQRVRLDKEDQATQINIFSPFQPMYAARNSGDIAEAVKKLGGPFMIEEKLDGERIQLHKKGDIFQYWSRQGKDYTSLYGRDRTEGALTPFIADAFREDVEECVLDGELLAWDPGLERHLPFGTLKTTALAEKTNNPDDPNVIYMVFDIVYLRRKDDARGRSLASDPRIHLVQRKMLLEGATNPKTGKYMPGVIRKVTHRLEFPYRRDGCTKPEQIKEDLDSILRRRGEGLILKKNTAMYTPSGRTDLWIKIKPDYFDELGENADLLVLGAWWGEGNRGGRIGGFLMGLKVLDEIDEKGEDVYMTVCKVGTGLNLRDFDWVKNNHQDDFRPFNRFNPASWPSCIRFADGTREDKPDLWIHPSKSFVLQVKGAEIVDSVEFAVGQTLRFPRAKYLRYDLATQQKMASRGATNLTMTEPAHFTTEDWYKLQSKSHEIKAEGGAEASRKKRVGAASKRQKVLSAFDGIDSKAVEVKDDIFSGTTANILTGSETVDQKELMTLFVEHGGRIKSNYKPTTDGTVLIVVSRKLMAQTNSLVQAGTVDILTPEWVLDSIKAKRDLPHFKKYVLFATQATKSTKAYEAAPEAYDSADESASEDGDDDLPRRIAPVADDPTESNEGEDVLSVASSHTEAEHEIDSEEEDFLGAPELSARFVLSPTPEPKPADGDTLADNPHGSLSAFEAASSAPAIGDSYLHYMVFYFDRLELWEQNGLSELDVEQNVSDELAAFEPQIIQHGGRVTADLRDPTLTHIVMCGSKDYDRYGELLEATMVEHKLRQIVAVSWLVRTFEEGSPQPESEHRPA